MGKGEKLRHRTRSAAGGMRGSSAVEGGVLRISNVRILRGKKLVEEDLWIKVNLWLPLLAVIEGSLL
jgi:hypothetical protein